jgi:hypothetical protein
MSLQFRNESIGPARRFNTADARPEALIGCQAAPWAAGHFCVSQTSSRSLLLDSLIHSIRDGKLSIEYLLLGKGNSDG